MGLSSAGFAAVSVQLPTNVTMSQLGATLRKCISAGFVAPWNTVHY